MNRYQGFTLIELLVVISIIGVLASIVLASLNSARVKARDARRIADLNQIRTALNFYYDSNNAYPSVGGWVYSISSSAWIPGLSPTYISTVPIDPVNTGCPAGSPWTGGSAYCYVYGYPQYTFPQTYDLVALLEDPNNPQNCALPNGGKFWKYHTDTDGSHPWCGPAPGYNYSSSLYADH
ncbi:MAG: type II secretion system protein [Candidatus Sungbacteria bacterium]|nr:type II secretion system protein [Candidatus Sungbacteria bacterium]